MWIEERAVVMAATYQRKMAPQVGFAPRTPSEGKAAVLKRGP
jgi:hypothetical protein